MLSSHGLSSFVSCALVNLGGVYWAWGLWKGYCKYQAKAKAKRSGAPAGKIE